MALVIQGQSTNTTHNDGLFYKVTHLSCIFCVQDRPSFFHNGRGDSPVQNDTEVFLIWYFVIRRFRVAFRPH